MFAKAALLAAAASTLAVATTIILVDPPKPHPEPISQCTTGDAQCCNSVVPATDPAATALLGLLGIVVQGADVLIGLGCTPITVIGTGGGVNCAKQPVCCQIDLLNDLINIGCTPLSQ